MVRSVTREVSQLVEPVLDELGFELVDVAYVHQHGRWVLRLYVDKPGGVTINDCSRVSMEIGDLIDLKNIIEHKYVLEVSSPGLNRPLKKERDFLWAIGKKIRVKTKWALNGRRNFSGFLKDFRDETLYLEAQGAGMTAIKVKDLERANLIYEFEELEPS
jgi:ribosome maturation factor RimP